MQKAIRGDRAMTLEGSTTVPFQGNGSFGVVHSYDVPTNSFSSQGVSYSGVLKNSIAGAMALVSLGLSPIVLEAPTNRITENSRYYQTLRNDYQPNLSSYILENERGVYEYVGERPKVAVFLERIVPVVQKYFGSVEITLDSWTSPVDNGTKLYLTIQSGIADEDILMDNEIALFSEIESNSFLQEGLAHVVIAIR